MRSIRPLMSFTMILAAGVMACSGGGSTTQPPPVTSVSGTWTTFIDSLNDSGNGIVCNDTGTVQFSQSGGSITSGTQTQTGTCYQGTPSDNSATLSITSGTVTTVSGSPATIHFVETGTPPCVYSGTVTGNPATSAVGTATCVGSGYSFSGTWKASR